MDERAYEWERTNNEFERKKLTKTKAEREIHVLPNRAIPFDYDSAATVSKKVHTIWPRRAMKIGSIRALAAIDTTLKVE